MSSGVLSSGWRSELSTCPGFTAACICVSALSALPGPTSRNTRFGRAARCAMQSPNRTVLRNCPTQ